MEDLIRQIDCGSKSDSIMMRILSSAMDKTQEKLQFKDGPIASLHERTTFYELAVILVEGCLKIVENDELEILESSSSKIVSELIEIREWLVGRIREMNQFIMEKDRESIESLENESSLREALELRERELANLYEKIETGVMKTVGDEKMILNTERGARRLHASCPNLSPRPLDKKRGLVLLEDDKMILNTERRARRSHSNPSLNPNSFDKECGSILLEDEKMILNAERRARRSHSSPNLSRDSLYKEQGLVELEDDETILNTERRARRSCASSPNPSLGSLDKVRGFVPLEDEKMILNTESRARRSHASNPNLNPDSLDKEHGLVVSEDEKEILNTERRGGRSFASSPCLNRSSLDKESGFIHFKQMLDHVFGRMHLVEALPLEKKWRRGLEREVESILFKGFVRDLQKKFDIELKKRDGLVKDSWFDFIDEMRNLFQELKDFFSRNDASYVHSSLARSRRTSSVPNLDADFTQNMLQNYGDDQVCGSHHVSKIIKSHESIIRRQREHRRDALQREGTLSWIKRNEDINAMERLIQDAITRLDNFTQRKHKVSYLKGVGGRSRAQEKRRRIPKPHRRSDRTSTTIQSFEAEIKKLQEERDGLCFQISVIEDTYQLLFRGVMKDFCIGSCCGEKETAFDESKGSDAYQNLMHYMESAISEDILVLVFQEMVEQWKMRVPQEDFRCSPFSHEYTESLLREDLYKIYFSEMTKAWRLEALKQFDFEVPTPQSKVMFHEEIIKESKRSKFEPLRGPEVPQEDFRCTPISQDYMESLLREEIYKIYFGETTIAWRSNALKQFDFEVRAPQSTVMSEEEIAKEVKMRQSDPLRGPKVPQEDFRCSPILQDYTESLLREEIYKIYFRETTEEWRSEALKQFDFDVHTPQSRVTLQGEIVEESNITQSDPVQGSKSPIQDCTECLLREEIYKAYFKESTEAWRSEALKQFDSEVRTPQSRVPLQEEIVKDWKISRSDSVRGSKLPREEFRCSPIQDCTECFLREEIYKIYLREMIKTWRLSEQSKQFDFELRTPQSRRTQSFQEGTPRSRGGDGESSMINKVDSLLRSLELEEDLMLKASSLIKEHSVSNNLVILDCEEMEERDAIEWLITDDESTFCSVSEKLERALQQLYTTKELLAELEESLEVSDGGGEYYENSQFNSILSMQEENTSSELELEGVGHADWSENVLAIIKKFRFLVDDVEVELHENLESKCLRLEALKRQVDALTQPVARIRTRKLLYKKAFISRCRNLRLAETEVDLLGDQVEALLSLLEKIYIVLSRDARVLSTYFEVYDILKLIKIELNGGRSSKPKSLMTKQ